MPTERNSRIVLLGLFLPALLAAQSVPVQSVTYEHPTFELPGVAVVSVYQTADGFLWASIYNLGVVRLESNDLTIFSRAEGSGGDVRHMVQDRRGNLWLGGGRPLVGNRADCAIRPLR
jgi:ligand-binding sensor domain-containing protein